MDEEQWWRSSCYKSLMVCFTTCMILGGSSLFFTFPCAFLAVKVSLAFPIAAGILFILCFTSFIITSFMDPGILQQGSHISMHESLDPKVVKVNGKIFCLKWCRVCQFYRPPRCSHCRLCNVCVEYNDEEDRKNPFTHGWKKNFLNILCGRIVPRYLGSLDKLETKKTSRKRDVQQADRDAGNLVTNKKTVKKGAITKATQGWRPFKREACFTGPRLTKTDVQKVDPYSFMENGKWTLKMNENKLTPAISYILNESHV
ncbi:uncharacterized protein LOC144693884 isoform X7 [Cetorhinus maximus]